MELLPYLRELRRFLLLIIPAVVVVSVVVYYLSGTIDETYTAEARLVVTAGLGTEGEITDVLEAPTVGQTYAVLATTRPVLLDVITQADLPYDPAELVQHLAVVASPSVPFVTVSVTDGDPERAAATANSLANVLVQRATLGPTSPTPGQSLLAVVENAEVPTDPTGPRVLFNTVLAAVATLVAGIVLVGCVAYLRAARAVRQDDRHAAGDVWAGGGPGLAAALPGAPLEGWVPTGWVQTQGGWVATGWTQAPGPDDEPDLSRPPRSDAG